MLTACSLDILTNLVSCIGIHSRENVGRTRGSKGGQRGGVTYADSTYGENDKITGAIRDKKFEGFSDLKGAAEKMKQRAHHQ